MLMSNHGIRRQTYKIFKTQVEKTQNSRLKLSFSAFLKSLDGRKTSKGEACPKYRILAFKILKSKYIWADLMQAPNDSAVLVHHRQKYWHSIYVCTQFTSTTYQEWVTFTYRLQWGHTRSNTQFSLLTTTYFVLGWRRRSWTEIHNSCRVEKR